MSDYVTFEQLENLLGHLQGILETHEQQLAQVVLGMSELYVGIESLMAEVMAPRSEEEREAFRRQLLDNKTQMLKLLGDNVGRGMASEAAGPEAPVADVPEG